MKTSRLFTFVAGIFCGIVLSVAVAGWTAFKAPSWLVVQQITDKADIAFVLGGGGGSRLRTGLFLYDAEMVKQLVLVDKKKEYWNNMLDRQCPDYENSGKNIVILEGSINTETDAQLALEYCIKNRVSTILVVTDPYHTRRALLAFKARFKHSNIKITVISSDDYGNNIPPEQKWWQDDRTRRVIWDELGKIFYMQVQRN